MLDIQQIRKHPKQIQKNFERRGFKISVEEILKLDREKRMLQTEVQEARHEKSLLSKEVAQRKKQRADAEDLLEFLVEEGYEGKALINEFNSRMESKENFRKEDK